MAETVEPTQKKVTVFFERAFKEFGAGSSASIHVETGVFESDDENTQMTAVREAFALAKRAVFEQLGVDYRAEAQEDGSLLLTEEQAAAAVKKAFPGTTEPLGSNPSTSASPSIPGVKQRGATVKIKAWDANARRYVDTNDVVPQWLVIAAAEKGVTEVAFNANSLKNPKAPMYKEIGKGQDGEPFWAPKEAPRGASSQSYDEEPF
jgi:hypothetical protein